MQMETNIRFPTEFQRCYKLESSRKKLAYKGDAKQNTEAKLNIKPINEKRLTKWVLHGS